MNRRHKIFEIHDAAVDNVIIQCVDDGPSDDKAESFCSRHHIIGKRRCKLVTAQSQKGKWWHRNKLNSVVFSFVVFFYNYVRNSCI